jgi:hypothetical protein
MRALPTIGFLFEDGSSGNIIRQSPRYCWIQGGNAAAGHYINTFTADARL